MLVRKKFLPKTKSDVISAVFLILIIPVIYWFELWVVLPELYDVGSFPYMCHFILGTFILVNVVGNFTYTILCDTSVQQIIVPTSKANVKDGWRFCSICESLAPPRSWHCSTCKTCILKRDHHCIFTGCCIGHFNQRYFLIFILYLFISTLYSFSYNNYFVWNKIPFEFPMSIVKIVFPLAIFIFGFDKSIEQVYLMLYIVTVIGMLFTGVLCYYHFSLIFKGCTSYEGSKKIYQYNLGWKQNLKEIFGEKWYLTWLLPYITSKLPQDGVSWQRSSNLSMNDSKNK